MMKSDSNKKKNLINRIWAGALGAMIIISMIILNERTFFGLFFIIGLVSLYEFYKLISQDGKKPLKLWGLITGAFIFTAIHLIMNDIADPKILIILFPAFAVMFIIKLYVKPIKTPFTDIAFTILGIIYISVPFSLLQLTSYKNGDYYYEIPLGILLLQWSSDTGAYFAGVSMGRTKLFPTVSPKKTWEGFAGGALLTMIVAIVLSLYFDVFTSWQWIIVGIAIVVAGTFGDLVESLFKRSISIKDSGNIIPGHGGFLDRFDGLLLALPFIAAIVILLF